MSIVAIDFETGGLDPSKHAIVSVGLVRLDSDIYMKVVDKLEIYILPDPSLIVEEQAAKINGYSREKWDQKKAITLKEAMLMIQAWLPPKPEMLAHNAGFDKGFMDAAQARTKYSLYLGHSWLCSMALFKACNVAFAWGHTKASLDFAARATGHWTQDYKRGDHGALDDALASAAIFRWCIHRMREGVAGQRELIL